MDRPFTAISLYKKQQDSMRGGTRIRVLLNAIGRENLHRILFIVFIVFVIYFKTVANIIFHCRKKR